MKHSNTWFALILIASALLLSAGKNAGAQSPSATAPSKPPTIQSHEPTPEAHSDVNKGNPPQVIESPFESEIAESLRAMEGIQKTARDEDKSNEQRWWPPSASWAVVYVTVAYVFVAIFQWRSIKRQADLADRSAKISQEMLDKDRPVIIITEYELTGFGPPATSLPPEQQNKIENYKPVVATFKIKNIGPAIAIMESGTASVSVFPCREGEFPKGKFPPIGEYKDCRALFLQKTTLKTDEEEFQATPMAEAFFTLEQFQDLQRYKAVMVLYGIIRYGGVLKRPQPYETPFFFVYQPAGGFIPKGQFYHGPDHRERNRAT
jgi:hypothetical protein